MSSPLTETINRGDVPVTPYTTLRARNLYLVT